MHIEASSKVQHAPLSSWSVAEEEQVVKEGLLRLVAMGVEVARCCVWGGHGRGIDGCQMKRAREKVGKRGLHPAQLARLRDVYGSFP